jgi:hypothetical protein
MNRMVMASGKKSYSDRSNAKLGQGPTSATGRARARHNALRSGLYAKTALLPFEDAKAYAKLRVAIFAEFGPRGALEEGLVELIIADLWRLNRFAQIENAFLEKTKLALTPRPADPSPMVPLASVHSGRNEIAVPDVKACPARRSRDGKFVEVPFEPGGETALLDAFVCRISQTPMEDVARQRRCASRELLRNIAALETLQARYRAINTIPLPLAPGHKSTKLVK